MWFYFRFLPLLLALVIPAIGCTRQKPDETKPFQGTWYFVDAAGKRTGKIAVIEKDKFLAQQDKAEGGGNSSTEIGSDEQSIIQVTAGATPPQIDFVFLDADNPGRTMPGIYSLEGDSLKICVAQSGADRPTDFTAGPKTKLMLLERKQEEPAKSK